MDGNVSEFEALKAISTGRLAEEDVVADLITRAHSLYDGVDEGTVSSYIPALATADPSLFGIALVDVNGGLHSEGDADYAFSIQSVSKPFVFALACQALGTTAVWEQVGVNNTGLSFNSVIALELNDGHPLNPMVNAGALITTSLVPGDSPAAKWENIRAGISAFAGRELEIDAEVYQSEASTNYRNRALANLLASYGRLTLDPLAITDLYTKQCSLMVTARDLAVMGATLACGGVNPLTRKRVVSPSICSGVLSTLASSGLYQHSGDWLLNVGIPGKSGVSGGIVTIAPGKGGLATFSPPLDEAGNSVRGRLATQYLSAALGLNLFASRPLD